MSTNETRALPEWWEKEVRKTGDQLIKQHEEQKREALSGALSFRDAGTPNFNQSLLLGQINLLARPGRKPPFLRGMLDSTAQVNKIPLDEIEREIKRRRSELNKLAKSGLLNE